MQRTTIILTMLLLLALTSCATDQPVSPAAKEVSAAVSASNLEQLKSKLSRAQAAANAGDFIVARQEFRDVEKLWRTIETSVRLRSHKSYIRVLGSINEVNYTLYEMPLSREKAIQSLQFLHQQIEVAVTLAVVGLEPNLQRSPSLVSTDQSNNSLGLNCSCDTW